MQDDEHTECRRVFFLLSNHMEYKQHIRTAARLLSARHLTSVPLALYMCFSACVLYIPAFPGPFFFHDENQATFPQYSILYPSKIIVV